MEDQFELLAEAAALDDNQNVKIMIKIIKISEFRYAVLVFYHKQPSCEELRQKFVQKLDHHLATHSNCSLKGIDKLCQYL